MTFESGALVAVAGLLCGVVNSIAGGGSLILFPSLLATGMSSLWANVTNSVATWPGYVGGVFGFRAEIAEQRRRLQPLIVFTVAGSASPCTTRSAGSTRARRGSRWSTRRSAFSCSASSGRSGGSTCGGAVHADRRLPRRARGASTQRSGPPCERRRFGVAVSIYLFVRAF